MGYEFWQILGLICLEGIFYSNTYWNCKYIVSFSGFDIGGCLLDWRLCLLDWRL
jgi:hypothetical protein